MNLKDWKNILTRISAVIILLSTFLWLTYLALTPIISRDALIIHMAFPKIWARESFLFYQDYNLSTLSMMNLDYIYMLLLKFFSWDGLPKIFHASLLMASGSFMYFFLKKRTDNAIALVFTLIFLTIPINQRLASETYVDLGVLFFSTLSIIYILKWIENETSDIKFLIYSAVFSGLSLGTKYTAAILIFSIISYIGIRVSRKDKNSVRALKLMLIYSCIVFLMISPWLIRNYLAIGNPFYPFLNSVFKPDIISVETNLQLTSSEYVTRKLLGESSLSILLVPFRIFFSGRDNDLIGGFDGTLNPLLLIMFIPLLFPKIRNLSPCKGSVKFLIFVFFISFLLFLGYGHLRIRYFIYIIPVLIISNALFFKIIKDNLKRKKYIMISAVVLSVFIFYNLKYSAVLFSKLDTLSYLFGKETKEEYLFRKLPEYGVAQKINEHAEKGAVIYEVLCGHRTYHIDRTVVYDDFYLDRYLYNFIDDGADTETYINHFNNLPFKDHKKAHYLLIKPHGFVKTYKDAFSAGQSDSLINSNISKFNSFLNSRIFLYEKDGTFIYKL